MSFIWLVLILKIILHISCIFLYFSYFWYFKKQSPDTPVVSFSEERAYPRQVSFKKWEQVFHGRESHFTYRNYSQFNIRRGVGRVIKIEAASRGESNGRAAAAPRFEKSNSERALCNARADRKVVAFHGRPSTEWRVVSEGYFDRNEWLRGPQTAIEFQAVFPSFQLGLRAPTTD